MYICSSIFKNHTNSSSWEDFLIWQALRVIEPVLLGEFMDVTSDDFYYACDLGLICKTPKKIEPSNPIYAEVMVRKLNANLQEDLMRNNDSLVIPRYLKDGQIDMDYLMSDFQQFWRENSDIWMEKFHYKEAAPHLILQAFLQRIINGGGHIVREMAAGSKRTDLCVVYENQKYPIELKIRRGEKSLSMLGFEIRFNEEVIQSSIDKGLMELIFSSGGLDKKDHLFVWGLTSFHTMTWYSSNIKFDKMTVRIVEVNKR